MNIVEMLFWGGNRDHLVYLWDNEIGETYEFGDQRALSWILGSYENCPLIFLSLLIVIIDIAWVLITIVIVANFKLNIKSLRLTEP